MLLPSSGQLWPGAGVMLALSLVYIFSLAIYNRFFHPLRHYPVRYGIPENNQLPLHERYGPIVRVAPDQLAISDPKAIDVIYGSSRKTGKLFQKAEFYEGFRQDLGGRNDSFSERDETKHAERRRIQAPLYTQGAVLSYEPCVDRIVTLLRERMDLYAKSGEVFDMSVWMRKYAFDVLGEVFFGREGGFGMIRDNVDYRGWCRCMSTMPNIGASITYIPYGFRTAWMLSEILFGGSEARAAVSGLTQVVTDAKQTTVDRLKEQKRDPAVAEKQDMLSKLINIVDTRGVELNWTNSDVTTEIWAMIWAGADTTAITLTAIFYLTHKHADVLARLRREVDTAHEEGLLSTPIRFRDTIKLPYLTAVVKESMRCHHSLGYGLPRIVPYGGAEVADRWIPGSTTVIVNANVVHFDKAIFGRDADAFNPDRWLDEKQAAIMSRHDLSFGYGPRVCLGKHITMMEMYKLIPALIRDYDFAFESPDTEWKVWHGWFQHQRHVNVRVKQRAHH